MDKVTIIDKFLAATFLKLIPKWVTPNHLTIFRFFSIPFVLFFSVTENYTVAIPLFIISAFSDALDGAKARTNDQITDWGKMFDPVADKILIGTVAVVIVTQYINQIIAFVIIALEVLIVMSAFYKRKVLKADIQANKVGKAKMIFQSFGIGFLMLFIVTGNPSFLMVATWLLYTGIFFALVSLFIYRSI